MAEYIEREALLTKIAKGTIITDDIYGMGIMAGVDAVTRMVLAQPAADVATVVRCKDCIYRGDYGCPMYHEEWVEYDDDGYREVDVIEYDNTVDDGFCSFGKRKDGDGNG